MRSCLYAQNPAEIQNLTICFDDYVLTLSIKVLHEEIP